MRKGLSIILIAVLLCAMASGCSGTPKTSEIDTPSSVSKSEEVSRTSVPLTEAPTIEPTVEPTLTPTPKPTFTPTPKPTFTPKPTSIPRTEFYGTWKSCGLTTESGQYYTVEQLEDIGNYNITDFYNIISESSAVVYIQGDIYNNVSWRTTTDGIVVGTNVMTLEKGKLAYRFDKEILWYERVTGIKSVNDIKKNPYVNATLGQKNALDKAKSYLRSSSFSYTGLIDQLEYSGFTHEEAVYAVENCGADWDEQASKKAQSYLKSSSFSYKGLIEQMEFTGFTHEQAVKAVDNCGADWKEQAVKKAQSYLKSSSFSKERLISQLEYSGFTHEQAVYAVEQVGY